jgi:DNA-directed RNA polymerase specialized sigma24 family protein
MQNKNIPAASALEQKPHEIAEQSYARHAVAVNALTPFMRPDKRALFIRLARRWGAGDDAEHFVQDAYLATFQKLQEGRVTGQLQAYIAKAVINFCRQEGRRRRNAPVMRSLSSDALYEADRDFSELIADRSQTAESDALCRDVAATIDNVIHLPAKPQIVANKKRKKKVLVEAKGYREKYGRKIILLLAEGFSREEMVQRLEPIGRYLDEEHRLHRQDKITAHIRLKKEYNRLDKFLTKLTPKIKSALKDKPSPEAEKEELRAAQKRLTARLTAHSVQLTMLKCAYALTRGAATAESLVRETNRTALERFEQGKYQDRGRMIPWLCEIMRSHHTEQRMQLSSRKSRSGCPEVS